MGETKLTVEEQQIIADTREKNMKLDKAQKAITALLKKLGANLAVNPNSPIGNPQIIVQME